MHDSGWSLHILQLFRVPGELNQEVATPALQGSAESGERLTLTSDVWDDCLSCQWTASEGIQFALRPPTQLCLHKSWGCCML